MAAFLQDLTRIIFEDLKSIGKDEEKTSLRETT